MLNDSMAFLTWYTNIIQCSIALHATTTAVRSHHIKMMFMHRHFGYVGVRQQRTKQFCIQLTEAYLHGQNVLQPVAIDWLILLCICTSICQLSQRSNEPPQYHVQIPLHLIVQVHTPHWPLAIPKLINLIPWLCSHTQCILSIRYFWLWAGTLPSSPFLVWWDLISGRGLGTTGGHRDRQHPKH